MTSQDLRFRLLGPLEIEARGRLLPLTGRQRALCAVLLLNANHVVSLDRVVQRLWDDRPPVAAAARVRSLVAEVRRSLGSQGTSVIVTRSPGYLLRVDPSHVDLFEFEGLFEMAAKAASLGNWHEALGLYEATLALWRGEPLPDLPEAAERHRFEELHVTAAEGRLEAAMALGRRGETVAELSRLAREYPLRERLHALLMRALHDEGRTAEALDVHASLRRRLADELGVKPSPELADLHRRLLAGDMPSSVVSTSASASGGVPRVPRQLPAATALFVGRADEFNRLDQYRESGERIVVVTGPAGAGKTTLALRWAHRAAEHFPGGQLFLDMRGFDRREHMTSGEALPVLLQGLGREPKDIPVSPEGQAALYQTLVADRKVLVVLDNAAESAQIRDLLPGNPHSLTVVTSRDRLSALVATTGARRITCDVLTPAESHALISHAVGAERVSAEPEATARLAALCDHLPLALCIAASRIGEEGTDGGIDRYVAELAARGRLARLRVEGDEGLAVRTALDMSYATLDPTARTVFRSLGLTPGKDSSVAATAASVGLYRADVEDALRATARVHLVRETGAGRFGWHDLVHEYATQRLAEEDSKHERRAATRRLLDHYLHSVVNAARTCELYVTRLPLEAADARADPMVFADPAAAYAWFHDEWDNLAAVTGHVADHGPRRYSWLLVDAMRDFLHHRRPLSDWNRLAELALRAAEAEDDPVGRAAMHTSLGRARWRATDLPRALSEFTSGERIARAARWPYGEATAVQGVGIVLKQMGQPKRALPRYQRSVELFREIHDETGEVASLSNLASASLALGRLREAAEAVQAALPLARRADQHLRALVLVNLGLVRQQQAELDSALAVLDEAALIATATASDYAMAVILETVGWVHRDAGRYTQATAVLAEALELADRVENRSCQVACLVGLADVAITLGKPDDAARHLAVAALIARKTGATVPLTDVLLGEAALDLSRGTPRDALPRLERAGQLAAEGRPLVLPQVRLLETLALVRLGETGRAFVTAREACRLSEKSGQRLVHLRSLRALADLHDAVDERAEATRIRGRAEVLAGRIRSEQPRGGTTPSAAARG